MRNFYGLAFVPFVGLAACSSLGEDELASGEGDSDTYETSTAVQEVEGDCWIQVECAGGTVARCSGTNNQCAILGGTGNPFDHYLANPSYATVFGHADAGFFKVTHDPGPTGVVCNGVTSSCPQYSGTALIDISDYTAASGSWPRTITIGETFLVYFTNQTEFSKYPALQLRSVSYGRIVSPDYISLTVVGQVPGGCCQL